MPGCQLRRRLVRLEMVEKAQELESMCKGWGLSLEETSSSSSGSGDGDAEGE